MKKKLLIAAGVLFAVAFVAVVAFRHDAGASDGAELVPEDAVLYAALGDLPRSFLRWQGTALAGIGREPEVRAFMEKPLGALGADADAGEAGSLLAGLKPGRIFLAVAGISQDTAEAIIGFQYWGGRKEFDKAVARMRRELAPGATSAETYAGEEIACSQGGNGSLYSASHGRWGFVSTSLGLIKAALDRAEGRARSGSLAAAPRYREIAKHLPQDPDFAFFFQPEKAIDRLLAAGRSLGAEPDPWQVAALRSAEAVGGALKMDGLLQRDALYILRKGAKPTVVLQHKAASFATENTVVFADFLLPLGGLSALLDKLPADPAAPPPSEEALVLAREAFGPECALVSNWSRGKMAPSGVLAMEVRDRAKAEAALVGALARFPSATASEQGGVKLVTVPVPSNPMLAPTFSLTEHFLLFGIDPASVAQAARPEGGEPLRESARFAPALQAFGASNEVFAFLDARLIFERAYAALRPVILFGAQVLPGLSDKMDTTKLPQTETVARHLAPIIYSQSATEEGILLQSSGPVSLGQLMLVAGAGSTFAAPKHP